MLPAPNRLRERADFASVIRGPGGVRAGSRLLVAHAKTNEARAGEPPRVGLVVSRAVGGAVQRNRTKRRLRALMTSRLGGIPAGTDLVLRAQPAARAAGGAELATEIDNVLGRVRGRLAGTGGAAR